MGVCAAIREACAAVAAESMHVRVHDGELGRLADRLAAGSLQPTGDDPARHLQGSEETTLAYLLTLDAVNFGSGWFPRLRKRPGMSGYFTVATALEERFAAGGAWRADELCVVRRVDGITVLMWRVLVADEVSARALAERFAASDGTASFAGTTVDFAWSPVKQLELATLERLEAAR